MYYSNKGSTVCCSGRKHSAISIIYMEKDNQLVYGELEDMVVDRCGCSS